jgi:16S rRNA (uracil1498-N3)-methyltransferase
VVERHDRAPVAGFYWPGVARSGEVVRLPEDVARHAHVRRLRPGARVRLTDGRGRLSFGEANEVGAKEIVVAITEVMDVPAPTPLDVIVPVADRDRMLMAAEKIVELRATAWRPTWFTRSRSVSPRGEGEKFREKVRARMISALEQSGGAWLPDIGEDAEFAVVVSNTAAPVRLLLEAGGAPIRNLLRPGALAIAIGPEGGLETSELEAARSHGWLTASLGDSTLRFETAIVAGVAVARALQQQAGSA